MPNSNENFQTQIIKVEENIKLLNSANSLDDFIEEWIEQDFSFNIFKEDLTNPKDSFDFNLGDLIIEDFINDNLDDLGFINPQ